MIDPSDVTQKLSLEGLDLRQHDGKPGVIWSAHFTVEGKRQLVMLFLDDEQEYFTIVAVVQPKLKAAIENTPARLLAALIRTSSQVKLAKLEYFETDSERLFAAVSDCSVEGYSGPKLRRRMHACAQLAGLLSTQLAR